MPISSNSLQKDALEMRRLNRLVVKAVAESNLSSLQKILSEYVETKKRIKTQLLEIPTPKIHDRQALRILQRLSEGENLPADNIVTSLEGKLWCQSLNCELNFSLFTIQALTPILL